MCIYLLQLEGFLAVGHSLHNNLSVPSAKTGSASEHGFASSALVVFSNAIIGDESCLMTGLVRIPA